MTTELDAGKCSALVEFSYFAAKEGGFTGEIVSDPQLASAKYFIPMICALTKQLLVTNDSEFDEAAYVLQESGSRIIYSQLNPEKAKVGDKIEIMKFFSAFAYEFRVTRVGTFATLCASMSRLNQLHIAHFISYVDNAIKNEDSEWWKILFLPYSDDEFNKFGICGNPSVSHNTPIRTLPSERSVFDSPVGRVINSPNGKDRLIQEYERRLNAERSLVQSLQTDYEESEKEIANLKVQILGLNEKIEKLEKNSSSRCGEECPNKSEMAAMRVRMNVSNNKLQQLNADLISARNELDSFSEAAQKYRLENRQLCERIKFLTEETEQLGNLRQQLSEMRGKLSKAISEKEDLIVSHTNDSMLCEKTRSLETELSAYKQQNDELLARIASDGKLISKYTADLGERDNVIKELKEQVENAVDLSELESAKAEIEQLHVKIQACDPKIYENTIDELKLQLECKNKVIEHLTSQFNRMKNSAIVTELKPINEPTELFNKSIEPKRSTTFSIPFPPKKQLNTTENSNFKYNDENRLNILRDRNERTPRHLRSHYATELDAKFSPAATMKFDV